MAEFEANAEYALHRDMMRALKERLAGIAAVIPSGRPVIYLDYPVHNNVGDLLIHQGADAFLEDYGYKVLGRFSLHDFSRPGAAREGAVVLKASIRDLDALVERSGCSLVLHGGGNFGDIWPQFQTFRELIIARYRDVPIVVLPQSIHFGSQTERKRSARLLSKHRHLVIFVRDTESLSFVRDDVGAAGEVVPDMAHQLWDHPEFAAATPARAGTLVMRRRDRESRGRGDAAHFDWGELSGGTSRLLLRALRKWQTIDNPLRHWLPNERLWCVYRDRLVRRAVEKFRPYNGIDTDRLHGMILGALMSKHVRYSEGSYGKLHRYAMRWLSESPLIESEETQRAAE